MAIKSSGSLSFSEIASEFGDTAPHSMSEFVRGGGKVPQAGANGNIPTSAAVMRFSHFFGAVNVIAYTASNGTNLNASTAFGSSWTDNVPKELIIPSGVTIGSSSTGTAALLLPTGMGGTLTIKNSGSIEGAGGAVGSNGGDAILAQVSGITIENSGIIYAGGGGGGTGGNGSFNTYSQCGSQNRYSYGGGCSVGTQITCCSSGIQCNFIGACSGKPLNHALIVNCPSGGGVDVICRYAVSNASTGGVGGVGQGYGQSASSGAAGGTNAGTGGTGGSFGSSGSAGANGNASNGSSGGLAGYYVNGIGNVTFSVTGTVGGRTA